MTEPTKVSFMRIGNSGICFAHGPYFDTTGAGCPKRPICESVILRDGPNPEYVALADEQVRQHNKVYTQADMDAALADERARADAYGVSVCWHHGVVQRSHRCKEYDGEPLAQAFARAIQTDASVHHDTLLAQVQIAEERGRAEQRQVDAGIARNWGCAEDEPTDPDVAFSCLAAAILATDVKEKPDVYGPCSACGDGDVAQQYHKHERR